MPSNVRTFERLLVRSKQHSRGGLFPMVYYSFAPQMREPLIRRFVLPQQKWEEFCDDEQYRTSGIFRDQLPRIEQLLREERRVVFLAAPGMGLSVLA